MDSFSENNFLIVEHLKEAKRRLGKSDADIAAECGISESTVRSLFSAAKNPSFHTIVHVARVLGVSIDEVCGIQPHRPTDEKEIRLLLSGLNHEVAHLKNQNAWLKKLVAALLILCILLAVVAVTYLIYFDLSNPNYGLFRG